MKNFSQQLQKRVDDPILANVRFENWGQVFTYLTEKIFKRKPRTRKSCFSMSCRGWPPAVVYWFHFSSITGATIGKAGMSC